MYSIDDQLYECEGPYRDREDAYEYGITNFGLYSYNEGEKAGFGTDEEMITLRGIENLSAGSYTLRLIGVTRDGRYFYLADYAGWGCGEWYLEIW